MNQSMEHHGSNPFLAVIIFLATLIGAVSLQEIDLLSGVILKWVSIISFLVAGAYTLWKWRHEYLKRKKC